jgi:hypothetical protein
MADVFLFERADAMAARAPEIERLLRDRPDLTPEEAAHHWGWACARLGPRGLRAAVAGRSVPHSDPPYDEVRALIDETWPRPAAVGGPGSADPHPKPSRRGGRPRWTRPLFERHLAEAEAAAEDEARRRGDPLTQALIAERFRPLRSKQPGEEQIVGIDPSELRRLKHKRATMPER